MVERIGCGANRSIGGQSRLRNESTSGRARWDSGTRGNRRGIHRARARARITGLVDLTDQFDANHSFAIYTPPSAARGTLRNASRARSRARRPPSSVVVSVTAQHLEISERVNYGPTGTNDGAGQGTGASSDCELEDSRVTGWLWESSLTRPDRLPRLRALARSYAALSFPFALRKKHVGCNLRPVSEPFARYLASWWRVPPVIFDASAVLYVGMCVRSRR